MPRELGLPVLKALAAGFSVGVALASRRAITCRVRKQGVGYDFAAGSESFGRPVHGPHRQPQNSGTIKSAQHEGEDAQGR